MASTVAVVIDFDIEYDSKEKTFDLDWISRQTVNCYVDNYLL